MGDFDSTEEYQVFLYFSELREAGFISDIKFQVPYNLYDGFEVSYEKKLVTKTKKVTKQIIPKRVYTLDFEVHWTEKANNIFTTRLSNYNNTSFFEIFGNISHIEVKSSGIFDPQGSTRLFSSRTQPWMFEKHGIYVQLIKPLELFRDTFIPKKVLPELIYKKSGIKQVNKVEIKYKVGDHKYGFLYKNLNDFITR